MVDWLNHQWLEPFGPAKCLFGRFLLTLSRIKRPQVMFMVKFSPTALNFGYDCVLLVHFLGHPVYRGGTINSFPLPHSQLAFFNKLNKFHHVKICRHAGLIKN